ncbi:unnamed protein product [Rodentolepis nana]|uniref:Protein shisa-5 n=1 Tax=Rodentolepis nana TaxID=102285 RepID=A0A0R3T031_RODNA|nr:unnamed protein product [Rodentolepis nana]
MVFGSAISTFSRDNALCCQISSGICFLLSLSLILGGSIMTQKYSYSLLCNPHSPWSACDDYEDDQKLFAIGVALIIFGCISVTVVSIMQCSACGFAAFRGFTDKPTSAVNQPSQSHLSTQMPMGSYTNTSFLQQSYISERPPITPSPYPTSQSHPQPCADYSLPFAPYLHPEMATLPPPMSSMPPPSAPHSALPPPYHQCVNQPTQVNLEK